MRAVTALVLGMAPACPGFIVNCIDSKTDNAMVRMYQLTWFISLPISLIVYLGLCYAFPPEGLGRKELLPGPIDGIDMVAEIDDQEVSGSTSAKDKETQRTTIVADAL